MGWERARVCTELTVQELWLRYIALGGVGDAFDVDAHLQGVHALPTFEEDVLAQAVNERLRELYHQTLVPLSTGSPGTTDDAAVRAVVDALLGQGDGAPWTGEDQEGGPGGR